MSKHAAGPGRDRQESGTYQDPPTKPRRKRVVLADSRAPVTVLRTVVELEEQTSYGEELVSQFVRTQLRAAIRFWLPTVLALAAVPALFFFFPELTDVTLAGVRLPWLAIGVLPFPLLFGVAYWYNSVAERQERDFVAMVEK
jgi:fatty acid desaturase